MTVCISRIRLKGPHPSSIFGSAPAYIKAGEGNYFKLVDCRTYERCSLMEFVRMTR